MNKDWVVMYQLGSCLLSAVLLILASQRIETAAGGVLWAAPRAPPTAPLSRRGSLPSLIEWLILAWVSGALFINCYYDPDLFY